MTANVSVTLNTMNTQEHTIKVSTKEHQMITALLMMHYTGLIYPVHETHRPTLATLAQRISRENIQIMIENMQKQPKPPNLT